VRARGEQRERTFTQPEQQIGLGCGNPFRRTLYQDLGVLDQQAGEDPFQGEARGQAFNQVHLDHEPGRELAFSSVGHQGKEVT
jgi:hypothetical protein